MGALVYNLDFDEEVCLSIKQKIKAILKVLVPHRWHPSCRLFCLFVKNFPSFCIYHHPQKSEVFAKIASLKNEDYIQANRLCGGGNS